jgi:hypothetical protein
MIPTGVIAQYVARVPDAPTSFSAYPYSNSIILSWAAPFFNGGLPVTSYTLKVFGSTTLYTGLNTFFDHTGLSLYPEQYSYTVVATNAVGDSATAFVSTLFNG